MKKESDELGCPKCGRKLKYNKNLKLGERDTGNNIIISKWYCPVCDY